MRHFRPLNAAIEVRTLEVTYADFLVSLGYISTRLAHMNPLVHTILERPAARYGTTRAYSVVWFS